MTLAEALAIYAFIQQEQSNGTLDRAQQIAYGRAMEVIRDHAVAAIEKDWKRRV